MDGMMNLLDWFLSQMGEPRSVGTPSHLHQKDTRNEMRARDAAAIKRARKMQHRAAVLKVKATQRNG